MEIKKGRKATTKRQDYVNKTMIFNGASTFN